MNFNRYATKHSPTKNLKYNVLNWKGKKRKKNTWIDICSHLGFATGELEKMNENKSKLKRKNHLQTPSNMNFLSAKHVETGTHIHKWWKNQTTIIIHPNEFVIVRNFYKSKENISFEDCDPIALPIFENIHSVKALE